MRVDVEARVGPLQAAQEDERRHGRTRLRSGVVAARCGHAAGDLLAGEAGQVNAGHDRVAHPGVDPRAREPVRAPADLLELRLQEDRVVGLVPREPVARGRKRRAVRVGMEAAAVALGRGEGKVAEVDRAARGHVLRGACPRWRPQDREDRLDAVLGRALDERVIDRPVVGGVGRVARVRRALLVRDAARAAPVEVHAERLDAERLVLRERPIGVAERLGLVEDPGDQRTRLLRLLGRARTRRRDQSGHENRDCCQDAQSCVPTHGPAPWPEASCEAPLRAGSQAPTREAAARG